MIRTAIAVIFAFGCLAAEGGEAGFATKPEAGSSGGKTVVTFKVNAQTDVAVYVLDASGKCIRHLAAGVLGGKNPPPAPLKAGLSQTLEWDGKDDYGKPAAGGPFKARVALGLKPEFAGFLNWHPDMLPKTVRVAVGPNGNVYGLQKSVTRTAFFEAANVICRHRKRWPGRHVAKLYERICSRKGHAAAIGAVGRHLAEATWWMLSTKKPYRDPSLGKQDPNATKA